MRVRSTVSSVIVAGALTMTTLGVMPTAASAGAGRIDRGLVAASQTTPSGWVDPAAATPTDPGSGTWQPWWTSRHTAPSDPPTVPAEVTGAPGEVAGQLDPAFSGDGIATPNFVPGYEEAQAVVIGNTNTMVAGEANGRIQLARFLSNGSPDRSFGGDGAVQTDLTPGPDAAFDVLVQPTGKYVVVGTASGISVAVRYLADGRLDSSFGDGGVVGLLVGRGFNFFSAVEPFSGGRLVFAGRAGGRGGRMVVAQVDQFGDPDPNFSGDGFQVVDFSSGDDWAWDLAIYNGRYYAAGATAAAGGGMAVARLNTVGALDPRFNQDGRRTLSVDRGAEVATSLEVVDGDVLVAGGSSTNGGQMAIAKIDMDGRYITGFGTGGWATIDFTSGADYAWDVLEDENGDRGIVLAGRAAGQGGRIAVARLEADGTVDTTFDGDGRVTTNLSTGNDEARGITIHGSHPDANSEVLVVGSQQVGADQARFALVKYRGS